jgi:hypothetical protein
MRSKQTKEDFIKYLEEHPEERFWQAIRNFSGYAFVLGSDILPIEGQRDTFYDEELLPNLTPTETKKKP